MNSLVEVQLNHNCVHTYQSQLCFVGLLPFELNCPGSLCWSPKSVVVCVGHQEVLCTRPRALESFGFSGRNPPIQAEITEEWGSTVHETTWTLKKWCLWVVAFFVFLDLFVKESKNTTKTQHVLRCLSRKLVFQSVSLPGSFF